MLPKAGLSLQSDFRCSLMLIYHVEQLIVDGSFFPSSSPVNVARFSIPNYILLNDIEQMDLTGL